MKRFKILTWHIHGSYLYYLSQIPHDFYLPVKKDQSMGYGGRSKSYAWPDNVHEIAAEDVRNQDFDCILYQHHQNWLQDQFEILSPSQLKLPRIFLEHNPSLQAPSDSLHLVDDSDVLIVHVTAFNQLMWDNQRSPTKVIEHGVMIPKDVHYVGDLKRGISVINHIRSRGRRMGWDILEKVREQVPVDLIGMGWSEAKGLCEVQHADLPRFCSRYRYFFSPVRYSSLALSVCEAMMTGLPIVGLATTEMVSTIENGYSGYLSTDPNKVVDWMIELTENQSLAQKLGVNARQVALERFHIDRFVRDWQEAFLQVVDQAHPQIEYGKGNKRSTQAIQAPVSQEPKRRIALISEHASPICSPGSVDCGGQNVYVAHLARQLAQAGHGVDVFTRRDHKDLHEVTEWEQGVRVIHVPAGPAAFVKKEDMLPYMNEFTDFMEKFIHFQKIPYDLIHANFWMSGLIACDLKQRLSVPFVVTFHALGRVRRFFQGQADGFSDDRFNAEDRIVAEADHIIAECPQDFDDLKTLYGADPKKISILPCGFDPEEIYPIDKKVARFQLGLDPDEHLALQLGRMVPRKGVELAIRGFARALRKKALKARLLIVGGETDEPDPECTPEISRLRKIAREEGILEKVHFFGRCDRNQLKFLFSAADVFITTPWYEPFGITPLEAMACGVPVIGTKVGGIKSSVIDRETGFLIPPNNPDVLADRLIRILTEPELHSRMSANAYRRAYQFFTWAHISHQMEIVYEEVLQRSTQASLKYHPLHSKQSEMELINFNSYLTGLNSRSHGETYGGNYGSQNSTER